MSVPRGRIRGFIRRPTPQEVAQLAEREYLSLTPEEAEIYARVLDDTFAAVDRLDELGAQVPSLRHTTRDPGRVPTDVEDPFHAFTRICEVKGADAGPLRGMRVGVKDNLSVAGIPVTNSSRTLSYTPTVDAVVVERMLDAGATVVAKTNLDDFSTSGTGESSWFGPARNAVDPSRSAGGSSGGSGSAVRSGAVDIAIGVDEGGSARIPASFNGIVSIKATHGLVPSHGLTYMDHTIDAVCPMASTVAATARLLDVISGHDDRDPQWVRRSPEPTTAESSVHDGVGGLRVGVVTEACDESLCDQSVLDALEDSCQALSTGGAEMSQISIPLWREAWAIETALLLHLAWLTFQSDGIGYSHLGEVDVERVHGFGLVRRMESDSFPPFLKTWLLGGRYLNERYFSTYFAKAANLRRALTAQVSAALQDVDLLVCPTTPHVAPVLLDRPADDDELLSRGTTMVANTCVLNLSGHPALAVPNGVDQLTGMPTSLQIVGAHWADELTFRAGQVIQDSVGPMPGSGFTQDSPVVSM
ncbi:amidase family protein [uncultured Gordonia sp.]|uniref:amidase family protein n=1 Tax=uncultured Gordonia sp. TaxID=198437 RepID=UPI00258BCAA9|nr:amidase family protein [uncultured Gordonia sp.]